MGLLKKLKSVFTKNKDNSSSEEDNYISKLKPTTSIQSSIIYIDELMLKHNKDYAAILWYSEWNISDKEAIQEILSFLNAIEHIPRTDWIIHSGITHYSLIVNFTLKSIQDTCITYFPTSNQFQKSLIEDLAANLPQSYIDNAYLNKSLTYVRTTLDGRLDDEFNEITTKSKYIFPIITNNFTIESADNFNDILDKIVLANPILTASNAYTKSKLLMLSRIKITIHINNKYFTVYTTQDKLPEELTDTFCDIYFMDESDAIPEVASILDLCKANHLLPQDYTNIYNGLHLNIEQDNSIDESNEEVITDEIITDDNERNDNNARKN